MNIQKAFKNFEEETLENKLYTEKQKAANNFRWYKQKADSLIARAFTNKYLTGDYDFYRNRKANYDLFNNIIDEDDFKYIVKPFGEDVGELPARLQNRDIITNKLRVLIGMEMQMNIPWQIYAINEDATTRRERVEFDMIKEYVQNEVMTPIRQQIELQYQQELMGRELSPQEQQEILKKIEEETKSRTPDEVRRYMAREHQDPAEALARQLFNYVLQKENVRDKFNKGFKHVVLGAEEYYHLYESRGEPKIAEINPMYFDYDRSTEFVQDGEWAVHEIPMTVSEVLSRFKLEEKDINKILDYTSNRQGLREELDFTFDNFANYEDNTIIVRHCVWKAPTKIGFLTYMEETEDGMSEPKMMLVSDSYKFNPDFGDINIDWEWIPNAYECYRILDDIYVECRPVPGQNNDIDNLYNCKLPYYGGAIDGVNSRPTSPMDRVKHFQYLFNIVFFRIEKLMSSDKGKVIALNINSIPKSKGINLKKMHYFLEANNLLYLNPNEEGNRYGGGSVGELASVIDMSLVSDIARYIELASFIENMAGASLGVTKPMEGQVAPQEAVGNTKQNIVQASHIIRPYYDWHNRVKTDVLEGLLNLTLTTYAASKPRKLSYILDDMSYAIIDLNPDNLALLNSSTLGLFVTDATDFFETKKFIESLSLTAMQNQQADISDVIKIKRAESLQEAEELAEAAIQRKVEEMQAMEMRKMEHEQQLEKMRQEELRETRKHEKEIIILKEEERRKTEIQKQLILSMGFNENKDADNDGTPDILEIAKLGLNAEIQAQKGELDQRKLEHQINVDNKKLEQQDEKLKIERKKLASKSAK